MKWVVKFAFYKETDVWLYEPYFSNPENPLCDIHVNIKVLKKQFCIPVYKIQGSSSKTREIAEII